MKKTFVSMVLLLAGITSLAQFTKATLQATGLTCAMCSYAINKALQKVSFVESVKSNIKNSSFDIVFKKETPVEIDALKGAVEDAGFSVGKFEITGSFVDVKISKDQHVKIGDANFHFLNAGDKVLNGEATLTVIDKDFVTEKEFKKYSKGIKAPCFQTGKAASCCIKDGIAPNAHIYHVTL
jgi:copper chaperone CopZ